MALRITFFANIYFFLNFDCKIKKGCIFAAVNDASVAQLVEHLTLNQGVQGSTPCGSTQRAAKSGFFHF